MKCSYFGCNNEVFQEKYNIDSPGMKFCKEYDTQIKNIKNNSKELFRFWINAKGGTNEIMKKVVGNLAWNPYTCKKPKVKQCKICAESKLLSEILEE